MNKIIESILESWDEIIPGQPVSYTGYELNKLCSQFTDNPSSLKIKLENDKLVSCDFTARYSLTDKGKKIKYHGKQGQPLPSLDKQHSSTVVSTPRNWENFKKLLGYYKECARAEERKQYYLNPDNEGKDFYIPKSMDFGWLRTLNQRNPHHVLEFDKKSELPMMQAILNTAPFALPVLLGYPLVAHYDPEDKVSYYIPIATVPVKYVGNQTLKDSMRRCRIEVEFDFKNASLNHAWFENYVDPDDRHNVLNVIDKLHKDDEFAGCFDMGACLALIHQLSSFRNEPIDPNSLEQCIPSHTKNHSRKRISNTVAFFKAKDSPYTKNLIRELDYIVNASPEELDQTSLAYIFREPPLEWPDHDRELPLACISSTEDQLEAANRALNNPLVQIQGPPGSGKSQVAVNIIANSIYYGKNILFTSKNHAAVDAIRNRGEFLLDKNIPMIQFCNSEGIRSPWYENSYLDIHDALIRENESDNQIAASVVDVNLDILKDCSKLIDDENSCNAEFLKAQTDFSNIEAKFKSTLMYVTDRDIEEFDYEELDASCSIIRRYRMGGIRGFFNRIRIGRSRYDASLSCLSSLSPTLSFFLSNNYAKFNNICSKLASARNEYFNEVIKIEEAYKKYKNRVTMPNLEDRYAESFRIVSTNAVAATIEKWKEYSLAASEFFVNLEDVRARFSTNYSLLLTDDIKSDEKLEFRRLIRKQFATEPAWTSTLLSLHLASPLLPGIFDSVIIDEAYQCDVISVLPAMFRAKKVVMIGDENQLRPIIGITPLKHEIIWKKHFGSNENMRRWSYMTGTAYDLLGCRKFNNQSCQWILRDHFRCSDDIASFFNLEFYESRLRLRAREHAANIPTCFQQNRAVQWIDVTTGIADEIAEAVKCFKKVRDSGYTGTIGIISPFARNAAKVRDIVYGEGYDADDVLINTVYSFQGGEKDVIIYMLNLTSELTSGQRWYIENDENRNLHNVAVSRAKACLVLIGDKERCANSSSSTIRMISKMPLPSNDSVKFDSIWEERLYTALKERGIQTRTQYYFQGYRFDMAYIEEGVIKMDIEVDGRAYHMNTDGTLKSRDIKRNILAENDGWIVRRFWVHELRSDMKACVDEIEHTINHFKNRNKAKLHSIEE